MDSTTDKNHVTDSRTNSQNPTLQQVELIEQPTNIYDIPNSDFVSVQVDMAPTTNSTENVTLKTADDTKNESDKKTKRKEKRKEEVTFRTHLTSLALVSVIVFVYLIIKLSFHGEFVLFTWHPILMGLGWALLMTFGFFAINRTNTYWRRKTTGSYRVKIHWLTLSIGYSLGVIGFIIVYINKNLNNKNHFVSWHAIFGLAGLVTSILPLINGTILLYNKELAHIIHSKKLLKFGHVLSGCLAYFFGAVSIILSVYTNWFGKKSGHAEHFFWTALITAIYPLLWALYVPVVKLITVVKDYFIEKED